MKALVCGACGDIQALMTEWRSCKCGNVSARWVDPMRGTASFTAGDKSRAFVLGLNNRMLSPALSGAMPDRDWESYRRLHEIAADAPGYVFDKGRANCWAVVLRVGVSNDVKWQEEWDAAEGS